MSGLRQYLFPTLQIEINRRLDELDLKTSM
jgi:hypothetical protein